MRRRRWTAHDPFVTMSLILVAFVTVDVVILCNGDGVRQNMYLRSVSGKLADVYSPTLWLFGTLGIVYSCWACLLVRRWVTAAGGPGFLIAILGIWMRFWGDAQLSLPGASRERWVVGVFRPQQGVEQFDTIVRTARIGGLSAYVVGLLIVAAFAAVDFSARYRVRKRLYGKAFKWPRWF